MKFLEKKKDIMNKVVSYIRSHYNVRDAYNPDLPDYYWFYEDTISTRDIRIDFTKSHHYVGVDKFNITVDGRTEVLSKEGKPIISLIVVSMGLGHNGSIPNRRIVEPPKVEENRALPIVKVVTDRDESLGKYAEVCIPLINLSNIKNYSDVITAINYACIGKKFTCLQDLVNDDINEPFITGNFRMGKVDTAFESCTNILMNTSRLSRLYFDVMYDSFLNDTDNDYLLTFNVDSLLSLFDDCVFNKFSYRELVNKYYNAVFIPDNDKVKTLFNRHKDGIYFSLANYILSTTEFKFLTVINSSIGKLPDYILAAVTFRNYDNFSLVLSKKVRSLKIKSTYKDLILSDDDILVRNLILSLIISSTVESAYDLEYLTITHQSNNRHIIDDGAIRSYTLMLWLQQYFTHMEEYTHIKSLKEEIDEARIFYKP